MKFLHYDPWLLRKTQLLPPHLYWQKHFDTHIFALLHQFSFHQDLVGANPVTLIIGRIGSFSDLDFSLLLVGWDLSGVSNLPAKPPANITYREAEIHHSFELSVDALVFNAAFSLDQWRLDGRSHSEMANA